MKRANVPAEWTWKRATDLCSDDRHALGIGPFGSDLKVSDYTESGVPLIFVRHIRAGRFSNLADKYISEGKARDLAAHLALPGDVLVTKMGDPPGDSAIYPRSRPPGVITADCIRWRINGKVADPRFLVHAMKIPAVRDQVSAATRGVAQKKISLGRFSEILFPVPPLGEQVAVADALDSYFSRLDEVEAGLERVQRNLKRYRASVLQAAVTGRLVPTEAELARAERREYEPASELLKRILVKRRKKWEESGRRGKYVEPAPPDTTNLPDLPEGWCWASLEQVAVSIRNGTSLVPSATAGVPILRISSVRPLSVDLKDVRYLDLDVAEVAEFLVTGGDLLFTRYNGSRELVGVCGLARRPHVSLAYPDKLIRVRLIAPLANGGFVQVAASSGTSRRHLEARIRTTAGQSGVSGADLKSMPIPLPPQVEQDRIAKQVDLVVSVTDELAAANRVSATRVTRIRQSILKRAFEGKLLDQGPSEWVETASAGPKSTRRGRGAR